MVWYNWIDLGMNSIQNYALLSECEAEEIPPVQVWLELRIIWQKFEMEFRLLHKTKTKTKQKNPQKQVFVTFCMIKQNIWWELIISPKLEKVVEGRWFQLSNWMYFLNLMRLDFRSGPVISILLFIHISVFLSIVVAVARNNPFLFRIINHPFLEAKF